MGCGARGAGVEYGARGNGVEHGARGNGAEYGTRGAGGGPGTTHSCESCESCEGAEGSCAPADVIAVSAKVIPEVISAVISRSDRLYL